MSTIEVHPLGIEATGDVKLDTLRAAGMLDELSDSLDELDETDPLSELDRIGLVRSMALVLDFLWRIAPAATFYVWSRDLPTWRVGRAAFLLELNSGRVLGWSRGDDETERERHILKAARAHQKANAFGDQRIEPATISALAVVGDAGDELVCEVYGL